MALQTKDHLHKPVLLDEVISHLNIQPDGIYVDATFGRGGHARAILDCLSPEGRLFAMDADKAAVDYAKQEWGADQRFTIQHNAFSNLSEFLMEQGVSGQVNGILFDLGVSSPQLDDATRGFSFMRSGPLDMRMDTSRGVDAATWIAAISEEPLANIIWEYGEERFSRRIARAVKTAQVDSRIETTEQLASIISKAVPFREKGKHPATRSFQAIRIAVNHELEEIKEGLKQSVDALKTTGRLLVISFHSLEDRIVKQFMKNQEHTDPHPAKLPIKHVHCKATFRRIGKAFKPSFQEIKNNNRARSAILRVGEKL